MVQATAENAATDGSVTQPFTPGPWHQVRHEDSDSILICTAPDGHWRICFMATPGDSPGAMQHIEADANLISAAPEMYEALKECHRALSHYEWYAKDDWKVRERTEAAIAKAEGNSTAKQNDDRTVIPTVA
jgi:hypothetical protein